MNIHLLIHFFLKFFYFQFLLLLISQLIHLYLVNTILPLYSSPLLIVILMRFDSYITNLHKPLVVLSLNFTQSEVLLLIYNLVLRLFLNQLVILGHNPTQNSDRNTCQNTLEYFQNTSEYFQNTFEYLQNTLEYLQNRETLQSFTTVLSIFNCN